MSQTHATVASGSALQVEDDRTGSRYSLPIADGAIDAMQLRAIKTSPDDFGLMAFDPGFTNTASCRSAITYIDGERGVLEYRGYPIEQVAERSHFLEVAYLLIHGSLPSEAEEKAWESGLAELAELPSGVANAIGALPRHAQPMLVLASGLTALGASYQDARSLATHDQRMLHARRLIAQTPLIAAAAMRHNRGLSYAPPDRSLGYVGSLLRMFFGDNPGYKREPVLEQALDLLFVLHADHEQNCSTNAVRSVASSAADPYSAIASGVCALSGPLHGGANEEVLRMLREIGSLDRVPSFVEEVKAGKRLLMGFGHRVYKSYDPRAKVIKQAAERVFSVTGVNPLLKIALELEKIALADSYFIQRKLYPNVDFYSGLIYEAMGFPVEMFPVLFAIARTAGWLSQWLEFEQDPDKKIARPRQIYTGPARRDMPERKAVAAAN